LNIDAEYIVVGSGAGGGTVAARLAEAGHTVLLLEAGGDAKAIGGDPATADDYDVPAFHARSTENEFMRWDFFVRHYADDARQKADPNCGNRDQGRNWDDVLYPRAGTLGGCTAHNAMILLYPHDSDWNELADLTGDPSWRADRMRSYFELLENCHHRQAARVRAKLGSNPSGHGFDGWLDTERIVPLEGAVDKTVWSVILESARAAVNDAAANRKFRLSDFSNSDADPNDARVTGDAGIGVRYTPVTTKRGARVGSRERILDVMDKHPDKLRLRTNALVTRVLLDGDKRAYGVEYLEGERLYRAHAHPSSRPGLPQRAYASREVILAGGAFNTPQLLMLSGVGPSDHLKERGITPVVHLPGVGKNLQDRYEVAVMNRMAFKTWAPLEGATFTNRDALYRDWAAHRNNVYATNGGLLSVMMRSSLAQPFPDLFLYALIGSFTGYYPGYSKMVPENPNCLTWVVLKGHTKNTGGTVTLASANPLDPPRINFHYFDEGTDASGDDLKAVVEGVKFARKLTEPLKAQGLIAREELPGDRVKDEDLPQFIRDHAWGHHASCSCKIGTEANNGVLTSDLEVHGTKGLRVVDASVFPRIPGLFIISAVYMVGEKAADVILADAKRNDPPMRTTVPVIGT
jgi:choline dehydrogenase-like flavoprotein